MTYFSLFILCLCCLRFSRKQEPIQKHNYKYMHMHTHTYILYMYIYIPMCIFISKHIEIDKKMF